MNAKEYLMQAKNIDNRINTKLERLGSLHSLATKTTSTLSDMPHSSSPNLKQMESTVCKLMDMEKEINTDIDKLVDLKREINRTIGSVKNLDQQRVLELRYLCFKSWDTIAEEMGYSVRSIFKIHNLALKNIKSVH